MDLLTSAGLLFLLAGFSLLVYGIAGKTFLPRFLIIIGSGDKWWSPYRVRPPQGEFYIMTEGTPDGPFSMIVESIEDHNYDTARDLFTPDTPEDESQKTLSPAVAWVGLNKRFLVREFSYTKWEQKKEIREGEKPEMELTIKTRGIYDKGRPPSYYHRYELSILINGMEIEGNVQIDGILDMTVVIESPRRAFFFEGTWITKLHAAVRAAFREYAGDKTFEQIREEKAKGAEALISHINNLSGQTRDEERSLRKVAGIYIADVRFVEFEQVGSDKMRAALETVAIAEQEAKASKLRGEGERDRDLERAKGRKALVEALGSEGAAIAQAEAISEAKPDVIVFGGGGVTPSINVGSDQKKSDKDKE